jgi:hypothetical protein
MLNLLTEEDIENIREDVRDVLEDSDFGNPIIYRRLVSRTTNVGTGVVTPVYSDTQMMAFRGDMTAREVSISGGVYRLGDEVFMFAPDRMDTVPRPDDRILREITSIGHVKLVVGSAALAGYNTCWLSHGVSGGDLLVIATSGAPTATIKAPITSDAATSLKDVWSGAAEIAVEFKIYRVYEIVQRIVDPLKAAVRLVCRRLG